MINALFGGPSWLEQANQQRQKDMANYLQGGVPQLMADTGVGQDLAGGFAGTTTPAKGIRAYHGSPYDFEKFDLSKIGTGEGAQAYGHGLYFAENPAVAAEYTATALSDLEDIVSRSSDTDLQRFQGWVANGWSASQEQQELLDRFADVKCKMQKK